MISVLNYKNLTESDSYFEKEQFVRDFLRCKKSSKDRVVTESKLNIFLSLRLVTVKNIENFFSLADKIDAEIIHTRDDMVTEYFLTMDNCINKFDLSKGAFYWYYNRALSLRAIRILDVCYHKYNGSMRVEGGFEDFSFSGSGVEINLDFLDFHMDLFGITGEEKLLIDAKFRKKTVNDFINSVKGMTQNRYFELLASVKKKLEPLRDEIREFSLDS